MMPPPPPPPRPPYVEKLAMVVRERRRAGEAEAADEAAAASGAERPDAKEARWVIARRACCLCWGFTVAAAIAVGRAAPVLLTRAGATLATAPMLIVVAIMLLFC
jgi:hypothetical protein